MVQNSFRSNISFHSILLQSHAFPNAKIGSMELTMIKERPKCPKCGLKMEQQYLGDLKIWVCSECGLEEKKIVYE